MSFDRIYKPETLAGHVVGVLRSEGDAFATVAVDELKLGFDGIADDRHHGSTRKSSSLEPWYQRGTEMMNDRQVTLVSPRDLKAVAAGMEIDEVRPEWLAANLLVDGIPSLSMLPPGSILLFEGGVSLRIRGQNPPCRNAGNEIGTHYPDRSGFDLLFPKVAKRLRGLLAYVEKPGTLRAGETVTVRIPEQWIYNYAELKEAEDAVAEAELV